MPKAERRPSPRLGISQPPNRRPASSSVRTEQSGVGGTGGTGLGRSLPRPLISIDADLKADTPNVDTVKFCKDHRLGDDICNLLLKHEYDGTDSLLDGDEAQLKTLGFIFGHIAELRWALNKMLLKQFPGVPLRNARAEYSPSISGGKGGRGGRGLQKGGDGGTGEAPRIATDQLHWARVIKGGTGGDGGAGGDMNGEAGAAIAALVQVQLAQSDRGSPVSDTILQGGQGGRGGPGVRVGGGGGLGGGPQMTVEHLGLFKHIGGGEGGEGGVGSQGGRGGDGEGPNVASLLHTIDDKIRVRVPYTKLEDVSSIWPSLYIGSDLCLLLQAQGFQTVGGLFEAYEIDLMAVLQPGHVGSLKTTLKKFARLVQTRKI